MDIEGDSNPQKAIPGFHRCQQRASWTITPGKYGGQQRAAGGKLTLRMDIAKTMNHAVQYVNFVVVTPAMAGSQPYRSFNYWYARVALFDEAAAMHLADGLIVYGTSMACRHCCEWEVIATCPHQRTIENLFSLS